MSNSTAAAVKLIDISKRALEGANPYLLVKKTLSFSSSTGGVSRLVVRQPGSSGREGYQGKTLEYEVKGDVRVFGAGKAVFSMCQAVTEMLGANVTDGVLSVPEGSAFTATNLGNVRVYYGATNNMPDKKSLIAAQEITQLLRRSSEADLIVMLISGGGSALSSLPIPPITLDELSQVTQLLSHAGASIQQLNIVRKRLEVLKGGGVSYLAWPSNVLGLILSDQVDNDLSVISSGPTCPTATSHQQALMILKQLGLLEQIPASILKFLQAEESKSDYWNSLLKRSRSPTAGEEFKHTRNVMIGSNVLVLESINNTARNEMQVVCEICEKKLDGFAKDEGMMLACLARYLCKIHANAKARKLDRDLVTLEMQLIEAGFEKTHITTCVRAAEKSANLDHPLLILFGGETIVLVKSGGGVGGRCQEMALSAAIGLSKWDFGHYSATIQCLGTDGQDGPTDAAGAFVTNSTYKHATQSDDLSAEKYLEQNDSYNFFDKYQGGSNHIKMGLSGTNVNDVYLLYIEKHPRSAQMVEMWIWNIDKMMSNLDQIMSKWSNTRSDDLSTFNELYLKAIRTYSSDKWIGNQLSAIDCAASGWSVVDRNELTCVHCSASINIKQMIHSSTKTVNDILRTSHSKFCPYTFPNHNHQHFTLKTFDDAKKYFFNNLKEFHSEWRIFLDGSGAGGGCCDFESVSHIVFNLMDSDIKCILCDLFEDNEEGLMRVFAFFVICGWCAKHEANSRDSRPQIECRVCGKAMSLNQITQQKSCLIEPHRFWCVWRNKEANHRSLVDFLQSYSSAYSNESFFLLVARDLCNISP